MGRRKLTPQEEYEQTLTELKKAFERHEYVINKGTTDPFWCDGVNANLVRNHIIYYKRKIMELHSLAGTPIPLLLFKPLPKEVSKEFMAYKVILVKGRKLRVPRRLVKTDGICGIDDAYYYDEDRWRSNK